MEDFYVYEWFNIDTKEVFYVGKGHKDRYKNIQQRNQYFKNYYNKYNCDVRKVKINLKEEEAFALEIELIAKYRALNQAKCNITDGGEGSSFPNGSWNDFFRKLQYLHDVKGAMDDMDNEEEYDYKNLKTKSIQELHELYDEYVQYKESIKWFNSIGLKANNLTGFELKIENEEIIMLTELIAKNIATNNKKFKNFLNYKTEMDFICCDFNTDKFLKLIFNNMDYYKELINVVMNNLWLLKSFGNNPNLSVLIKVKSYNIKDNYIHIKFNTSDDKKMRRVKINLYDIMWGILMFKDAKALYQIINEEIFSAPFI